MVKHAQNPIDDKGIFPNLKVFGDAVKKKKHTVKRNY